MFDQISFDCRMEWGLRGAREAAERGDIVIIVDVLSFSSAVTAAVSHGAIIYPHPANDRARTFAESMRAPLLPGRAEAARTGGPSLSPASFGPQHRGQRFVMSSQNGAACTQAAAASPALLIGCLLNARAVARAANRLRAATGAGVTVVPCGERWHGASAGEDRLRPALEDYLGAGAILGALTGSASPEAEVCALAFRSAAPQLSGLLRECGSGRELRERGFAADVLHCSRLDVCDHVPMLQGACFADIHPG